MIDDLVSSGRTLTERLDHLVSETKANIAAILVIAQKEPGASLLEKNHKTRVLSVINDEDISCALRDGII